MKKLIIILPLLVLLSCSVQKRHYQKGYFVRWNTPSLNTAENKSRKVSEKKPLPSPSLPAEQITSKKKLLQADLANSFTDEPGSSFSNTNIQPHQQDKDSCDILIYRNGSEIRVKIIEINSNQIKYTKCSMENGPVYISNKSELFMAKYANGTKEIFKTQDVVQQPTGQPVTKTKIKKETKLATTSLVFSILGFYPLVIVGGIVAMITALIQLKRIMLFPDTYGGATKAKVGLIMGAVSFILWVLIFFAFFMFL